MTWTIEKLKAKSVADRHQMYKNAKSKPGHAEAEALVKLLEESGLPLSEDGTVKGDDPLVIRMYEIINSSEGVKQMLRAVEDGWPPLAGADPLIATALGVDYGKHNGTTNWAGQIVWEKMSALGFKKSTQRELPKGCVARSGVSVKKSN